MTFLSHERSFPSRASEWYAIPALETQLAKYKLVCTLRLGEIPSKFLLWLLVIAVTFGIAVPFFVYYFVRTILNNTEIHQIA